MTSKSGLRFSETTGSISVKIKSHPMKLQTSTSLGDGLEIQNNNPKQSSRLKLVCCENWNR